MSNRPPRSRVVHPALRACLLGLMLALPLVAQAPPIARGEALWQSHSCASCHQLPLRMAAVAEPLAAPHLDRVGERLTPAYLRAFLAAPHTVRPGTRMPDLLNGLAPAARIEATENLVHFLAARGSPPPSTDTELDHSALQTGARLYEEVGCRACHAPDASRDHARAQGYSLPALAAMLADPLRVHPSGRMPDLALSKGESTAIAAWILRDQRLGPSSPDRSKGLHFTVKQGRFAANDPELEGGEIIAEGIAAQPNLDVVELEDEFGVSFRGELWIEDPGEYSFWLSSDDGSWLEIDGRMVIDHGGLHAATAKFGSIQLERGYHAIRLSMFERAGGQALKLEWEGPENDREVIPASHFSFARVTLRAPRDPSFVADPQRIEAGARIYTDLGCANCHEPQWSLPKFGPALEAGHALTQGCTTPGAPHRGPRFDWKPQDVDALRAAWNALGETRDPRAAATHRVERILHTHQCRNCHERDGEGGPDAARDDWFRGTADLGDAGRIPPSLTRIGGKLQTAWLDAVLTKRRRVRPYMVTRMPHYGEALRDLAHDFRLADGSPGDEVEPEFSLATAEAGRHLIGRQGFSCINCHFFSGIGQPAYHAIDLALAGPRLLPGWQREILERPDRAIPGTRMVRFWEPGQTAFPHILGGDQNRQIDAIRSYLTHLEGQPLPAGTRFARSKYDLVPKERVLHAGVFMRGLSARVSAVGDPSGVHYAFDREHVRLAKLWRGGFLNVAGTWHDRAGQLEVPESLDVRDLPRGPALASLNEPSAPWPRTTGRQAGYRMLGEQRDAQDRPTFKWSAPGFAVRETITPWIDGEKRGLRRRLLIEGADRPPVFTAWPEATLEKEADGAAVFHGRGGMRIEVLAGQPFLVPNPSGTEARVSATKGTEQDQVIEVLYRW